MSDAGMRARWMVRSMGVVARRPSLWVAGARQVRVLARPGWWRRRPFLPVPDPGYLRFRLQTAYGGAGDQEPDPEDLVTYLRWCRDARRWGAPALRRSPRARNHRQRIVASQ